MEAPSPQSLSSAVELIEYYQKLTPQEIQDQIKPIIQSYRRKKLAKVLGVSVHVLYQYCKQIFVKQGGRPDFTIYAKIMALGPNPDAVSCKLRTCNKPRQRNKEVQISQKEYQHKYYLDVTKPKRALKRKGNNKND